MGTGVKASIDEIIWVALCIAYINDEMGILESVELALSMTLGKWNVCLNVSNMLWPWYGQHLQIVD